MRKTLLAGVTALVLSGCALFQPGTNPVTLQTVSNDINSIATGLNNAVTNPQVAAAIPGGIPAKVSEALMDLAKVAQAAAKAPDATAMKGNVAIVESDVNVIIGAIGSLPLPPPAPTVFAAVEVLLPAIEAAIGVPAPASAGSSSMTPDQARAFLMTGKM